MIGAGSKGLAQIAEGVHLAYEVRGPTGRGASDTADLPLLLNRPLGGSMALWGDFAGRLATVHRVIEFDPRGVGASSDVPVLHSTRDMARDAVSLLDVLGIERAHVLHRQPQNDPPGRVDPIHPAAPKWPLFRAIWSRSTHRAATGGLRSYAPAT